MNKNYNNYGEAALKAAAMKTNPLLAWERATEEVFDSKSSKEKSCPKGAFLGLCEEGLVKGIPGGKYTKSSLNKGYAIESIKILSGKPNISKSELWDQVKRNLGILKKDHNSQMEVVLALWENEFINQ